MFNVFNRGVKTKSFTEIVPIKQSSSGTTNSANKLPPLKNACLTGFFSEKILKGYSSSHDQVTLDIRPRC